MNRFCTFLLLSISIFSPIGNPQVVYAADEARAETTEQTQPGFQSRLTIELQGVNILDVFKILSKKSGLNIVAGKNVQGQVSIFLQDVPVQEALKTILESQGLASIEENGVIKVMSAEEYLQKYGRPYEDKRITKSFQIKHAPVEALASKLAELKSASGKILTDTRTNLILITDIPKIVDDMQRLIEESDHPQETAVFRLRFAKAEDLEPKIKNILEGGSGKVEIDKRSNRIVIIDIPSHIERIRPFIKSVDVPVPEVLIEAKIVEVRLSDAYRQGINWQEIIRQLANFKTITATAPLTVSPPAGAAALTTLALGANGSNQILISLLEQIGKTNLLSSPRLTVLNNEEAKLAVATRQPFVSQTVVQTVNSTNTADNVQFIDVGVTLKVQPRISHDDFIELKIKPEVSSSNQTVELQGVAQGSNTTFTRTRIPVVTTQELETTVLVKSGTTLVIGGLIQEHQEKETSKVPIIGSIPLLGRAFQSKAHDFTKTELVTFLTPTIVKPIISNHETERFVNREGQILPFDQFADYPFLTSFKDLKRHEKFGEVPYWEDPSSGKNDKTKKELKNAH